MKKTICQLLHKHSSLSLIDIWRLLPNEVSMNDLQEEIIRLIAEGLVVIEFNGIENEYKLTHDGFSAVANKD